MEIETTDLEIADTLDIALTSVALFEQYDELVTAEPASNDCYENLYPNVA